MEIQQWPLHCVYTHIISIYVQLCENMQSSQNTLFEQYFQVVYVVESAYSFSILSLSLQLNLSALICMGCLQWPFWLYDRLAGGGKTQMSKNLCCLIPHWFSMYTEATFQTTQEQSKSGTNGLKRRKILVVGTFTWKSERKGFSKDGFKEGSSLIKGWSH